MSQNTINEMQSIINNISDELERKIAKLEFDSWLEDIAKIYEEIEQENKN
jgi:hypothetical protein